jgi:hypothetical protein
MRVVATKGYTGHQLGAAGATEVLFTVRRSPAASCRCERRGAPVDPEIAVRVTTARERCARARRSATRSRSAGRTSACWWGRRDDRAPHDRLVLELRGSGLWTPGFADAAAWSRRHVPGTARIRGRERTAPRAELLPPMLRRRTSLLTRMAAEVAAQAIAAAGSTARR